MRWPLHDSSVAALCLPAPQADASTQEMTRLAGLGVPAPLRGSAVSWFGLGQRLGVELDRERVGPRRSTEETFRLQSPAGVFRPKLGVACVVDIFVSLRSLTRGGPVGVGPGNVRWSAPSVCCAGTEKTIVVGGSGVSGCR